MKLRYKLKKLYLSSIGGGGILNCRNTTPIYKKNKTIQFFLKKHLSVMRGTGNY
jgi:hypothetical protein